MQWRRINNPGTLGAYVRSVSDSFRRRVAGTVITSIKHVYASDAQYTSMSTSFAEIDFPSASRGTSEIQGALNSIRQQVANLPVRWGGGGGTSGASGDTLVWNEDSAI